MSGDRFISMVETGVAALLVTLALVAGYIVIKRMVRQMRKGVVLATRQSIDEVTLRWATDGRLQIHVHLPSGMSGRLVVYVEYEQGRPEKPAFESIDATESIEASIDVPSDARAIVIEAPMEKLYRPLPTRI
ncbi:MAG: hypothetical protein CMD33_08010 [Flavobacteriales bacterium]|nr:hypothetical protein [Flavobacteriales bacterium]